MNDFKVPKRCEGCPVIRNTLWNYENLTRQVGLAALGEDGLNIDNSLEWVEKTEEKSWSILTELVVACEQYSEVQNHGCRVPLEETSLELW